MRGYGHLQAPQRTQTVQTSLLTQPGIATQLSHFILFVATNFSAHRDHCASMGAAPSCLGAGKTAGHDVVLSKGDGILESDGDGISVASAESIAPAGPCIMDVTPRCVVPDEKQPLLAADAAERVDGASQAVFEATDSSETPASTVGYFLNSEEGMRLQERGIDSFGALRTFQQAKDEQKAADNLYALSMMSVIVYHGLQVDPHVVIPDSLSYLTIPLMTEDCMTCFYCFAGYYEGQRALARGGRVVHTRWDILLLLAHFVMRWVLPKVMMPIWSLIAASGTQLQPIAAQQGWGHWKAGEGWTAISAPWVPYWFLSWLVIAKLHAVVFSHMQVPPALQVFLALVLGNVNFLVDRTSTGTFPSVLPVHIPLLSPYIDDWAETSVLGGGAHGNVFWNNGFTGLGVTAYLLALHYAAPLLRFLAVKGKSTRNAVLAFFGVGVCFLAANQFHPKMWQNGFPVFGAWDQSQHYRPHCAAENQSVACRFVDWYAALGGAWIFALLFWPTIVCLKLIVLQRVPFHLQWMGTTTLGALMIHPYCPSLAYTTHKPPTGSGLTVDNVEYALGLSAPLCTMLWLVIMTVYAFLIQYTVGAWWWCALAAGGKYCEEFIVLVYEYVTGAEPIDSDLKQQIKNDPIARWCQEGHNTTSSPFDTQLEKSWAAHYLHTQEAGTLPSAR